MVNSVTVTGRIYNKKEHEKITTFNIQVGEKRGEEWQNFFLNCVAFGKARDQIRSLQDKNQVLISGRITINKYKTKDGAEKEQAQIIVSVAAKVERQEKDNFGDIDDFNI